MTILKFVGGVSVANTSLEFGFWDESGNTLISSFSTTFAQAGHFIWTITVDSGGDAVMDGKNGWLEIMGTSGATGKWFLTTTAPTIGSQAFVTGTYRHAFAVTTVPAPGAIALLECLLGGAVSQRTAFSCRESTI